MLAQLGRPSVSDRAHARGKVPLAEPDSRRRVMGLELRVGGDHPVHERQQRLVIPVPHRGHFRISLVCPDVP